MNVFMWNNGQEEKIIGEREFFSFDESTTLRTGWFGVLCSAHTKQHAHITKNLIPIYYGKPLKDVHVAVTYTLFQPDSMIINEDRNVITELWYFLFLLSIPRNITGIAQ